MERNARRTHIERTSVTARQPLGDATSRANSATPLNSFALGPKAAANAYKDDRKNERTSTTIPDHHRLASAVQDPKSNQPQVENVKSIATAFNDNRIQHQNLATVATSSSISGSGFARNVPLKSQIGPWKIGKRIGRGGWSTVWKVRHIVTGQYGAAKVVSKASNVGAQSLANLARMAKTDPSLLDNGKIVPLGLEREIIIMKLLEHRNIVRLYDVWENHDHLYLIMEYVGGGELYDLLSGGEGLGEVQVVHYFRQIIAALLHCHRLNIHHRDLKLENILLDSKRNEIKLVDFGMAALQPLGKFLSTACGSPQYAAPEVISKRPYDGGQADVWSCGVILYVMLTGRPPFDVSDFRGELEILYNLIRNAEYYMPPNLSPEAKDLIQRILVPQPQLRIAIDEIWCHPFLHKYDREFGLNRQNATLEYCIGPNPAIDRWDPLTRETIDPHIFRNLRTLWHSEREERLIRRLINDHPTQEKFFYSALLKFRENHLENYYSNSSNVKYSRSDRQLGRPGSAYKSHRNTEIPLPRSKSQFSILNNEHLLSKESPHIPSSSCGSQDPFKVSSNSREAFDAVHNETRNHKKSSTGNHRRTVGSAAVSKRPTSLRKDTLQRRSRRSSMASTPSLGHQGSAADGSGGTAFPETSSPATRTSSAIPSSPPCVVHVRKSSYKRGVSFTHSRRSSIVSTFANTALPVSSREASIPKVPSINLDEQGISSGRNLPRIAPPPNAGSTLQSKKRTISNRKQVASQTYHVRDVERHIENETRRISNELKVDCDTAFNGSSVTSSTRTAIAEKPNLYDTPPSSVSNRSSYPDNGAYRKVSTRINQDTYADRPLPPLPQDTPKTVVLRELEGTRKELNARYSHRGSAFLSEFDDVFSKFDSLLESSRSKAENADYFLSAPAGDTDKVELTSALPAISENQILSSDTAFSSNEWSRDKNFKSHAQDELRRTKPLSGGSYIDPKTIRVIKASSPPSPVLPLNIRKVSSTTTKSPSEGYNVNATGIIQQNEASNQFSDSCGPRKQSSSHLRHVSPVPVAEDNFVNNVKELSGIKPARKWHWLRWKDKKDDGYSKQKNLHPSTILPGMDPEKADVPTSLPRTAKLQKRLSDFPMPMSNGPDLGSPTWQNAHSGEKGKFFRFLAKFGEYRKNKDYIDAPVEFSDTSSLGSGALTALPQSLHDGAEAYNSGAVETQQNWLARVLHIKPASHIMCFHTGRGRVRQEIVRQLREWKKYGVKDVNFDRKTNLIAARVDKNNFLKIKAVHFTVELFAVLEQGRRAKLCIARFTQTRGAASSFQKVVETLQMVLAAKGVLVEDEVKWREMCEVLD